MSLDIIIIFLNLCVKNLNDTHFKTEEVYVIALKTNYIY